MVGRGGVGEGILQKYYPPRPTAGQYRRICRHAIQRLTLALADATAAKTLEREERRELSLHGIDPPAIRTAGVTPERDRRGEK